MDQKPLENLVMRYNLGNVHHERRNFQRQNLKERLLQRINLKERPLQRKDFGKAHFKKTCFKQKKSQQKLAAQKFTPRKCTPRTSNPISFKNTSHVDSLSAHGFITRSIFESKFIPNYSAQGIDTRSNCNRLRWKNASDHFGIVESQPRIDERFIAMRKRVKSSVSEHPRYVKCRKQLLRERIHDL